MVDRLPDLVPLDRSPPARRHRRAAGGRPTALVRGRDRLAECGTADAGGAARPGRPRRLLDLHLRQLAAHAALRPRLGCEVRGPGADHHRRPHPGVRLRARPRQHRRPGPRAARALPDRRRQRLRRLADLRQPLLARRLHRRCAGPHPLPPLRRGRVRDAGDGHPAAPGSRPARPTWTRIWCPSTPSAPKWRPTIETLRSPETYLGYGQATGMASPDGLRADEEHDYAPPSSLRLNQWAPTGAWSISRRAATATAPNARLAYRFQARDVNLVMGPADPRRRDPLPRPHRRPAGNRRRPDPTSMPTATAR